MTTKIIDNRKPFGVKEAVAYLRDADKNTHPADAADEIERRMKGAEERLIEAGEWFYKDGGLFQRSCWPHKAHRVDRNGYSDYGTPIVAVPVTVTITVENA